MQRRELLTLGALSGFGAIGCSDMGLSLGIGLSIGTGGGGGGSPTVTGALASRTRINSSEGIAALSGMARTAHFARGPITSLQVKDINWGNVGELNGGGTTTITAAVEYPVGTFTQIKYAGSVSGSIAAGSTVTSDLVSVAIPDAAKFFLRRFLVNATKLPFNGSCPKALGLGDLFQISGATDMTMGGTITDNSGANCFWPAAIIGPTTHHSHCYIGDSRVNAANPTASADPSGFVGEWEASFGPLYGAVNIGTPTDTIQNFLANHTRRFALVPAGVDRFFVQYGINDVSAGRTAAQMYADHTTLLGLLRAGWPGCKVYIMTVAPRSTGAWTAADGSDQTANAASAAIDSLNVLILANAAGHDGVYDVSSVARLGTNQDKWNANGTAAKYTGDGLHESAFTNNSYAWADPG